MYTHPAMHDDFNTCDHSINHYDMNFACESISSFRSWFHGVIEEAYDSGLTIAKYKVSNLHIGQSRKQCLFHKDYIIDKEYLTLEEFNNLDDNMALIKLGNEQEQLIDNILNQNK